MFDAPVFQKRRQQLMEMVKEGLILLPANQQLPANFPKNPFPFRQDSTFLYYCGIDLPGVFLIIDIDKNKTTLYGTEQGIDDTIWTGPVDSLRYLAQKSGINDVQPVSKIKSEIKNKKVHFLNPYQKELSLILSDILQTDFRELPQKVSESLLRSVIKQRSVKENIEITQIEDALNNASVPMHKKAMQNAIAGKTESDIVGIMQQIVSQKNFQMAFLPICSIHGEILHNHTHYNTLKENDLLLIDAGAENKMHYASDITRTTPVNGKFTNQQKEIYSIVLDAQQQGIRSLKSGVLFRDIHFIAAKVIAQGLIDLNLIKTNVDEAVELGLHTLFFPHGIGHMLGLDVHDMENLGEDNVGYNSTIKRSNEFGTAYLRLAKKVETKNVVTIEPGIYFIPELISKWENEKLHSDKINYTALKKYLQFGGIRIEDTVLVQDSDAKILGDFLPKTINDIETLFA